MDIFDRYFPEDKIREYKNFALNSENDILRFGVPLTEVQKIIAVKAGIKEIEKVRILNLNIGEIKKTVPKDLLSFILETGFMSDKTNAITYGYGIFYTGKSTNPIRTIAHELKHIEQYEKFCGINNFIDKYINQIKEFILKYSDLYNIQEILKLAKRNIPIEEEAIDFANNF